MRILVVEDDSDDIKTFETVLDEAGYDVVTTTTGEDALVFVKHNPIDAAIVDLTLKGARYGGMTFIKECRRAGHYFPVLVVTAKPLDDARDEVSRTIGGSPLDYADNYMEKRPGDWPSAVREHLRNLIIPRRMLVCPPYKFDRFEKCAYFNNAPIDLRLRQSRILEHIMQHRDRVVPPHKLYHLIRDDDATEGEVHEDTALTKQQRNLVHHYVGKLRSSLPFDGQEHPIQTVPNEGYRFNVPHETRPPITVYPKRVIVNSYQLELTAVQQEH